MSITSFLERKSIAASPSGIGYIFGTADIDQQFLRLEHAIDFMQRAKNIHTAACQGGLSTEEIRFSHYVLNECPPDFTPAQVRMESYAITQDGLKYRAEGIIDSIIDGISSFFKWIGDAFSKLFGGSGSESSGPSGADAAAKATEETAKVATTNGTDEFLFKESHSLFKVVDLGDLKKVRDYYDAIAKSTKAIVEINKKAIELSKKGVKEYQGDFAKDVVTELKGFAVPKTTSYAKNAIGTAIPDGTYFAYPTGFLKARAIVFGEDKITLPNVNETDGSSGGDKTGQGYTPKEVYIKVSDWKSLVDTLATSGKLFYDQAAVLKESSSDYNKLAEQVKGWKDMKPEEVKKVGDGLKQMNNVASFTFKAVKHQTSATDKLFKMLRDVAENELRDAAKAGRKKEADDAEAKKNSEKAAESQKNVHPDPNTGAHSYVD